jgi:pyruvate dehydrogenase E2 component (dihydrolipoamide acetyltransferase)
MAVEIKMPQLSDTMSAGKILSWKKNEGDRVERGDILAEVETDKANLEIECFNPGTILKVVTPAGTNAKVGEVIAIIGQPGEQVSTPATGASTATPAAQPPPATPTATPLASSLVTSPAPTFVSSMVPQISSSADRIKASPLARKVAQQRNIDLATIQGSGPNGRIVRDDVERAGSAAPVTHVEPTRPQLHAVAAPAIPRATSEAGGQRRPFSKMRETIARRMQESVVQAPHFYTTTSISMIQALRLRGVLKERAEFKGISVNHLVVKAAGYALAKEPRVNYAVKDNEVYIPNQINIGIITAIEDGLLIPVVREVDTLALKDLVFEARAAVERAKAGRPSSTDLTGGTFSISNMGMFDVDSFTAIINPGQGAILAVGSVREEPVVQNGQIVIDQRMKVTLSVDHRIIDGVMAGTFLRHFKEALEIPALLM